MAKKIADTKKMTREQWLELRKSSIGGSDAAATVSMNPYSSLITLYADKKGMSKEKETTEAMRLGTDLEGYVAERFCEKTGKKVRNDFFMYADDEYDFLTANVDRRIVGENAGLECKTMSGFNGYNLEAGEIPSHYYCQVMHYMMVMGFDRMYMAILVFQKGVYDFTIERDDDFIQSLRAAEIDFWQNNVLQNKIPAPDGSEASLDTLKELYPVAEKGTEISIFGLDQYIVDYRSFKALEKEYKEKADELKARIAAKLGDNEVGIGDSYSCSYKNQSKPNINPAKLKASYPKIYEELVEMSNYRVLRTKQLKK